VASGRIPVLAPEGFLEHAVSEKGFLEHAVSENAFAGGAMTRRATYM
jgi:alkyl sulfatase BDS1-like metallo-beta-lactamase superfamily hydrolase